MVEDIVFQKGRLGLRAVIKGSWLAGYRDVLLEREVKELELNDGKGWRGGQSIDFLHSLPDLKSLTLLDFKLKSVEAIHSLSRLEQLNLSTYASTAVNFSCFPNLVSCDFEWIKGSESLFECINLTSLGVNRYGNSEGTFFSKLINLTHLTLMNSKIESLEGLTHLTKLKYLSLAGLRNVKSLEGFRNLSELNELGIQSCKRILDFSEVFELRKLRRLLLLSVGDIATIVGIEKLTELEEFYFYESTNIVDGNLFPLANMQNLRDTWFQNRRHYTHKREYFRV